MIKKLTFIFAAVFVAVCPFAFAESTMVLIKGGTFTMGSPLTEKMRGADEKQHSVRIDDFYADAFEVRQSDYEKIMGRNPSINKGSDFPVENVTFFNAIDYCNKKSDAENLTPCYIVNGKNVTWNRSAEGYRLLTEAEWEYACRAGTSTIFNTGNWNNPNDANYEGSYPYLIEENYVRRTEKNVQPGKNRGRTIAVDSLKPNAFGLYNMHGNVSEWVFDFYGAYSESVNFSDDSFKNNAVATNPAGSRTGIYRINRGGGYNDFGKHLRSAYRSAVNPLDADQNLGFRIGRSVFSGTDVGKRSADSNNDADMFETVYDKTIAAIAIPANPKILVTYFSYSGNTQSAAEYIATTLKAKYGSAKVDLVEIEMQTPYRGGIYDATQKDLMNAVRPPLKTRVADFKSYDVVLLGYPTWWATLPMPVVTFLESYDFAGKTVISFSSHGGTMFGDSVSDLCKALGASYVKPAFEFFYGGGRDLEKRIDNWLTESGL